MSRPRPALTAARSSAALPAVRSFGREPDLRARRRTRRPRGAAGPVCGADRGHAVSGARRYPDLPRRARAHALAQRPAPSRRCARPARCRKRPTSPSCAVGETSGVVGLVRRGRQDGRVARGRVRRGDPVPRTYPGRSRWRGSSSVPAPDWPTTSARGHSCRGTVADDPTGSTRSPGGADRISSAAGRRCLGSGRAQASRHRASGRTALGRRPQDGISPRKEAGRPEGGRSLAVRPRRSGRRRSCGVERSLRKRESATGETARRSGWRARRQGRERSRPPPVTASRASFGPRWCTVIRGATARRPRARVPPYRVGRGRVRPRSGGAPGVSTCARNVRAASATSTRRWR